MRFAADWQTPGFTFPDPCWFPQRTHPDPGITCGKRVNSLVQAAKSRARGYRNVHRFISMLYPLAGKLKFRIPYWGAAHAFANTK